MQSFEGASPAFIITVCITALLILKFTMSFIKFVKTDAKNYEYIEKNEEAGQVKRYYSFIQGYQRTNIFTQREYKAYFILKEIADEKGLVICPKVRLLDIVKPIPGIKKYSTLRNKVMSKHVDFVVCTEDMQVYAIVELDDSSHFRPDRIKRDNFVDSVLHSVGYPVIHTYAITSDIFDGLPQ